MLELEVEEDMDMENKKGGVSRRRDKSKRERG